MALAFSSKSLTPETQNFVSCFLFSRKRSSPCRFESNQARDARCEVDPNPSIPSAAAYRFSAKMEQLKIFMGFYLKAKAGIWR